MHSVPWMSGLVSGLQNRVRRFESARNLHKPSEVRFGWLFCCPKKVRIFWKKARDFFYKSSGPFFKIIGTFFKMALRPPKRCSLNQPPKPFALCLLLSTGIERQDLFTPLFNAHKQKKVVCVCCFQSHFFHFADLILFFTFAI